MLALDSLFTSSFSVPLFLLSPITSISLQLWMLLTVCHKPRMLLRLKAQPSVLAQFLRPVLRDMKNGKFLLPIKKEYYSLNGNS